MHGDNCVHNPGPEFFDLLLKGGQGNHLPAYLGKALGTPLNGHKTIFVHVYDVPGVIPPILRRLDRAGSADTQVAQHDIRPLDIKAPPLVNPRDGLRAVFHPRHETPHRADAKLQRCVDGDNRGLRCTIPLNHANAEFLPP